MWKASLVFIGETSKKFNLCMYILRTEKQGGSKLMFMPFEIVSICVWLWYFFSETCRTAAYSHLHKGLRVPAILCLLFYPA